MKKNLTIAMVSAQPFPSPQGTQVSVKQMSQALSRLGHKVHVVCYHIGDPHPANEFTIHRIRDCISYSKFRAGPSIQKPALDLLLSQKLYEVVRRERVDIMHAHNYEAPLAAYIVRFFTKVPVVYHAHNLMSDELHTYFSSPRAQLLFRMLGKFLDMTVPRMADHTIAISSEIADYLNARGARTDRLSIVPLGIFPEELEKRDPGGIRGKYGLDRKFKLILYSGNCDRYQDIPLLFEAMPSILRAVPDARLAFITNELDQQFVELARRTGVEQQTFFMGTSDFQHAADFFSIADVAVSPRTSCPGIPIKLLNYMAARLPVVAFKGSAKNLVSGRHCIAVENGDVTGFAAAVIRLLQDKGLAEELGENAYAFLRQEYDWATIAQRIESVYYDLLVEGKKRQKGARSHGERLTQAGAESNINRIHSHSAAGVHGVDMEKQSAAEGDVQRLV